MEKPQVESTKNAMPFTQSVIEVKKQSSILKNSTIEIATASALLQKQESQKKINNQTLNETLKVKIDNLEEKKEENVYARQDRSLDKSAIDFMSEAKDFSNIIGNLKSLLNKGKTQSSNKSYMTLDPVRPPSSQMASHLMNQSYMTSINHNISTFLPDKDQRRSISSSNTLNNLNMRKTMPVIGNSSETDQLSLLN